MRTHRTHRRHRVDQIARRAAYDAYLKGQAKIRLGGPLNDNDGVRHYQQAVELDPHFALAWAGLSSVLTQLYGSSFADSAIGRRAREAAERAAALVTGDA